MAGLLIFTGANSSLGVPAADYILRHYPQSTVIFTVRDASDNDANTKTLREVIARHPEAKASIAALDLASLSATHAFADTVVSGIQSGQYPRIQALVCVAYYWNLVKDPETTADGYDKTFQVGHISHSALILRLLGSFGPTGRVVLLSSDSHWPGKNSMEKYPPTIPKDLELLVNPAVDNDKMGRGYQRYATTKLAITTWMYALNEHLQQANTDPRVGFQDPDLKNITAVAINPGNLIDSRALRTNTPKSMPILQTFVYKPLLPLLKLAMGPTLRTAAPAGADVAELALNDKYVGERGFYTLLNKDESSPESQDKQKQSSLWAQTLSWAKISSSNTKLQV